MLPLLLSGVLGGRLALSPSTNSIPPLPIFFESIGFLGNSGQEQYELSSLKPRKGRVRVNISYVIHPSAQMSMAFVYSGVSRLVSIPTSGATYVVPCTSLGTKSRTVPHQFRKSEIPDFDSYGRFGDHKDILYRLSVGQLHQDDDGDDGGESLTSGFKSRCAKLSW